MNPAEHASPKPGTFIREIVGHPVSYCLEVLQVIDCSASHAPGVLQIVAKRWGVNEQGQPIDDGHSNTSYHTDRIRPVGAQAWRFLSGQPWRQTPRYWRQIQGRIKTNQQTELFA